MAIGTNGGRDSMGTSFRDCTCSILNAREETLLDDVGRVQVRLICNRCGAVLDSEIRAAVPRRPTVGVREAESAEES